MEWTIDTGGTMGDGSENTPVIYPRSEEVRAMSDNNKGGASTGGEGDVNYKVGPYPVVEDAPNGVDEGG